jgi:hypothetical protein
VPHKTRPRAKPVAELIGRVLDPVVRKRGLARSELLSWWPDIVGAAYAGHTAPERIKWPRDGTGATLVVACDPSLALQLSYETDQVRARINGYLGYPAIAAVRIVQRPIGRMEAAPQAAEPDTPPGLDERLRGLDEGLRGALLTLGRRVFARS